MMDSARWEPIAGAGLERRRRRLGFSPMPILPILSSVDHSHCSSREDSSSPYLEIFSGYSLGFVLAAVTPHSPNNAGDFVGQGDRGLVHSSVLLHLQSPCPQPVGMLQPLRSDKHRARSVDEKRSQVDITSLADSPESSLRPAGVFLWSQAEEAREFAAGREAQDPANKGGEGGRRHQPDTRDRHQTLDNRHIGCESTQLLLGGSDALFELTDLQTGLSKSQAQGIGNGAVGVLDQGPDPGYDVVGADRQRQANLAQDAADGVDAGSAVADPGRAEPMQTGECLLRDRLDRDGMDLLVAMSFEQAFGVGTIGLVAPHVGFDIGRGQQQHLVAELTEFSSPMMGHAAGLEEDEGGFALGKEREELFSGESMGCGDLAWMMRDRDLEHVLCQIDSDCGRFSHGLLLSVCQTTRDYGTQAGVAGGVHPISEAQQRYPASRH